MQMLAWLSVAMISSCPWPMSRWADAIAASSARVMVFVTPDPLGLMEREIPLVALSTPAPTTFILSSRTCLELSVYHIELASRFWLGMAWLMFLYGHYVSIGWAELLPWLLVSFSKLLAPLEPCDLVAAAAAACMAKLGTDPVVWKPQITQGNFQLCVPHVSCIARVIAFLVAAGYDVYARPEGPGVVSLAFPRWGIQERNVLYISEM